MLRTDKEILDQTNQLADLFYQKFGFISRPEVMVWEMACLAQLELTGTDVYNSMDILEI